MDSAQAVTVPEGSAEAVGNAETVAQEHAEHVEAADTAETASTALSSQQQQHEQPPQLQQQPQQQPRTPTTPLSTTAPSIAPSIAASVSSSSSPPPLPPPFTPLICVVDFHHARGPEVAMWFGVEPDPDTGDVADPALLYDWPLLPFMALSDGAHASTEDFSYFTLLRPATPPGSPTPTSLFGISCTRQMDASQLHNRPSDVTRSTVQKAVVVIADSPQFFGMLRERLSVVTTAWFDQREFSDVEILRRFQESLAEEKARGALGGSHYPSNTISSGVSSSTSSAKNGVSGNNGTASNGAIEDEDRDQYLGMSLRELVHEFRWQTLVLLKCCLLQPKMLFFGSRCERLCMMQFSLVSLIPGLLRNLQDCAGPELDSYAQRYKKATSLRTSDRNSLLSYAGLPLQIFGKGSLFGPYTPLQQLDVLADVGTKSYIVGSTNSLLLQQRDRYSDILINLDETTVNITSTSLRSALQLSAADRRWIDFITQEVNDTWDEANPGRPKTMGYVGSEEFIRLQFEEYLLSFLSSVKYHNYMTGVNPRTGRPNMPPLPHIDGDPAAEFGAEFVDYWSSRTENYRLWQANTDTHLFEFIEPRHPCAGGLTVDDVQRRIAQQVQDFHLDERFAVGREALGRNLAAGQKKASTLFNKFYSDMEALREAQRKRAEEARQVQQLQQATAAASAADGNLYSPSTEKPPRYSNGHSASHPTSPTASSGSVTSSVDLSKAQQTVQSAGARASAYMSSWATWAGEKRKTGWSGGSGNANSNSNVGSGSGSGSGTSGGGWGMLGSGRRGGNNNSSSNKANRNTMSSFTSDASSSWSIPSGLETPTDLPPGMIVRNLDEEYAKKDQKQKEIQMPKDNEKEGEVLPTAASAEPPAGPETAAAANPAGTEKAVPTASTAS